MTGRTPHPVRDPFTRVLMCWCGLLHHTALQLGRCTHQATPFVPGNQASERSIVPPADDQAPTGPRRLAIVGVTLDWVGVTFVLAAILLVVIPLVIAATAPAPAGTPVVVPTTHGAPRARGRVLQVNGCEGHESLEGAEMGVTVFCDGACVVAEPWHIFNASDPLIDACDECGEPRRLHP